MHTQETVHRLLSIDRVIDKTSKSRSSIYEEARRGEFPKPIKISANRVAWPESAIDAWIASKMEAA